MYLVASWKPHYTFVMLQLNVNLATSGLFSLFSLNYICYNVFDIFRFSYFLLITNVIMWLLRQQQYLYFVLVLL